MSHNQQDNTDARHERDYETLAVTVQVENRPADTPAAQVLAEISAAMAGVLRFENAQTSQEHYTAEIQTRGPVSSPLPGVLAMGRHPSYGQITVSYEVPEGERAPEYDFTEEPEHNALTFSLTREVGGTFPISESLPALKHLLSAVEPVIGKHTVEKVEAATPTTIHVTLRPTHPGKLDPRILSTGLAAFRGAVDFPNLGTVRTEFVSGT